MQAEKGIEFGLKEIYPIPWIDLNILTQTRGGVDQDGLEELTRSIEALDEQAEPRFEMLHPPLVNVLRPEAVGSYVSDLNACFDTEHALDELHPNKEGNYVIVVAGHRRRLAAGALIYKYGADPAISTVACNVRNNLTFGDALRLQIQENTHLQLPVYETARAIQATYRYGLKTGHYRTLSDCVRELPFSEDKIRNALKFCELPSFLQDWVEANQLKYGAAVAIHPLIDGYRNYYKQQYKEETREAIVSERLMALGIQIMAHRLSRESIGQIVRERLEAMSRQSDLVLFNMDELKVARSARHHAYGELFAGGLGRLRQFTALARGRYFKDLPLERREAILDEIGAFYKLLGGMAASLDVQYQMFE